MEKALNLRVEDANGNRVPTAGRTLRQKTRRVCEDFGEGSPDTRDIEPAIYCQRGRITQAQAQVWTEKEENHRRGEMARSRGFHAERCQNGSIHAQLLLSVSSCA